MNEINQWMKRRTRASRRGAIPWWAWAVAVVSGLSVLIGWILRRRSIQTLPEPAPEDQPSPKIQVADNTPVSSIPPVVQDIPLPIGPRSVAQPAMQAPPAATAAPAVLTAQQVGTVDDLTIIEGIGPIIAEILQRAGITTFTQLAETDASRLEQILKDANLNMIDPTTWAEQARYAASGDQDGLQALKDQLKGGRRS